MTLLASAWLIGRIAAWFSSALSPIGVATLDSLFPFALALLFAREVIGARNRRNYKVVAIVLALAFFNVCFHLLDGFALRLE